MKKHLLILVALLLAIPVPTLADNFNYDYLEAGYTHAKHDQLTGGDGYSVRGSLGFGSSFFGYTAYDKHHFDHMLWAYGWDYSRIGGGMHVGLSDNLDFVAHLGYVSTDTNIQGFDFIDHGYEIGAGFRERLSDSLELNVGFLHDTVAMQWNYFTFPCTAPYCTGTAAIGTVTGTDHAENVASVGFEYALSKHFNLGLGYSESDFQGMREWSLSGRWNF